MNSINNPTCRQWREKLYDWESLMRAPSIHRRELNEMATLLLRQGHIDLLEHWDMQTMAMAAESHAIESRIDDFLQPDCQYNLIREDGSYGGHMDGYGVYFDDSYVMVDRGLCVRGEHHFRVITYSVGAGGQLVHDQLTVDGRPPHRLVLRSRRVKGVIIPI